VILALWILLTTVAGTGAAVTAMTTVPRRRAAGLLAVALAVAGLLLLLGLDLAAVAWLGVGVAAALLALPGGHEPDLGPPAPGPRPTPGARLAVGTGAGLLFAMFYRVVQQTHWAPAAPAPVTGQAALLGGRLLTEDLAPLLVAVVVLAVALAALVAGSTGETDRGGDA
jgi:hypothetical protein